jgi:hypothetical protein
LPDGTPFVDVQRSVTKAVIDLPPGEARRLEVNASKGTVLGLTLEGRAAVLYPIEGPPGEGERVDTEQRFVIGCADISFELADNPRAPRPRCFENPQSLVENLFVDHGPLLGCRAMVGGEPHEVTERAQRRNAGHEFMQEAVKGMSDADIQALVTYLPR